MKVTFQPKTFQPTFLFKCQFGLGQIVTFIVKWAELSWAELSLAELSLAQMFLAQNPQAQKSWAQM